MEMDMGFGDSINTNTTYFVDKSCDATTFGCNICFDLAQDPIVTLCGHLFCWPCLYRWLHFHSYSNECPVCKSLVQEEKLVPIYGRGKTNSEPKSQSVPEIDIPSRPSGQRPETSPPPDITYFRQDEFGIGEGFMTMATARLGSLTRCALFSAIPSFFNFQMHGFHDATVYGTTSGVPYLFSTSVHGGYAHGFHQHSFHGHGAKSVLKICFLFLGLPVILLLISSSPF